MKKHLWIRLVSLLFLLMILLGTSACGSAPSSEVPQSTPTPIDYTTTNSDNTSATPTLDATASTQTPPTATPATSATPIAKATMPIMPTATPKPHTTTNPTPTQPPTPTPVPPATPTPTAAPLSYHQVGTMTLSSASKSSWDFDISWVDQASNMYYLADRNSKGVDIFDLSTQKLVKTVTGFSGPNGVVADNQGQLWVGDSDSTVKIINLQSETITGTISTGGKGVTDEMAYDPQDQLIMAANGDDSPAFVTLISASTAKVVKKITISGAEGLEQPAWDAQAHLFYISVPKTPQSAGGAVAVIDPQAGTVSKTVSLSNCNPTGFALGPNHQALIGCDGHPLIMDLSSWQVLTTLSQINGCDEVWYNIGDQHYYLAADGNDAGPVLGVVNAQTLQLLQSVPTKSGAHSVAAAASNNHILVPTPGTGIAIYAAQ